MKKTTLLFASVLFVALVLSGCKPGEAAKTEPDDPTPEEPLLSDACSLNSVKFVGTLNPGMTEANGVLVTAGCAGMKNYYFISANEGVDLTKMKPSFSISDKAKIYVNGVEYKGDPLDCTKIIDISVVSESGNAHTNYKLVAQNGDPTLDYQVYRFMQIYGLPGISMSIMQDEKIIYSKGYGAAVYSSGNYERMTPNHLLRLASVSKTFCAVCLMVLYERGLLSIDDTVFGEGGILCEDYPLPEGADPRIKDITIRNLMQHNSGWTYAGSDGYDYAFNLSRSLSARQRIENQLKVRLSYDVGTKYSYLNMGYMILGEVVKKLSGQDYGEFLEESVLKPMGITNIHIAGDTFADRRPDECMYYGQSGTNAYNGNNYQVLASLGGIIASTPELMRYLASLDGRSGVPDLLKKETLDLMYNTINTTASTRRALCWMVNHSYWPGAHFHTGDLNGTASILVGNNNRGRSGAVVCNSRSYRTSDKYIYGTGSFDDNLYGLMKYALDYTYK